MKASSEVARALRNGTLVRQPCAVCGVEPAVAHHDDYARPLDVRWLCRSHHSLWHAEHGSAPGAILEGGTFITVKMPEELRDGLAEIAARRDRTVAAEIRLAIKAHLAKVAKEAA